MSATAPRSRWNGPSGAASRVRPSGIVWCALRRWRMVSGSGRPKRAGAASAAVVAVGLLVYRLVRLIRAANDMIDAWQEVRSEVLTDPPLQKRLKQLDDGQAAILAELRRLKGET